MKGETTVVTRTVCAKCHREITGKPTIVNHEHFCQQCFNRNFVECNNCGALLAYVGAASINGIGHLCSDCRAHIRECEVCGTFQHKESMTFTNIGWTCVPCFDRNRELIIKI